MPRLYCAEGFQRGVLFVGQCLVAVCTLEYIIREVHNLYRGPLGHDDTMGNDAFQLPYIPRKRVVREKGQGRIAKVGYGFVVLLIPLDDEMSYKAGQCFPALP